MAFKFKHVIDCDYCGAEIEVLARSQEEANEIIGRDGWMWAHRIQKGHVHKKFVEGFLHSCGGPACEIKEEDRYI